MEATESDASLILPIDQFLQPIVPTCANVVKQETFISISHEIWLEDVAFQKKGSSFIIDVSYAIEANRKKSWSNPFATAWDIKAKQGFGHTYDSVTKMYDGFQSTLLYFAGIIMNYRKQCGDNNIHSQISVKKDEFMELLELFGTKSPWKLYMIYGNDNRAIIDFHRAMPDTQTIYNSRNISVDLYDDKSVSFIYIDTTSIIKGIEIMKKRMLSRAHGN